MVKCHDMTEKMLTGTLSLNTNKQNQYKTIGRKMYICFLESFNIRIEITLATYS